MNYTILIADDEPEIRTLLRLYLENENYQIIEAENGKQALELLKKEHVDLCLLDIMMPEMGGREATRAIRAMNRPDAKSVLIMAMSANTLQEDIQENRNAGMNDHISKPISLDKLKKVLQECDLKA